MFIPFVGLISVSAFVLSVLFMFKYRSGVINRSFYLLAAFVNVVLYVSYKTSDYFTGKGIDESVIFHLRLGLNGVGIGEYLWLVVLIICILILSLFVLTGVFFLGGRNDSGGRLQQYFFPYIILIVSLSFNPATINLYTLPEGTIVTSRSISGERNREFYNYYQKPEIHPLSTEHKNLVFIYAESLEQAFFNEEIFPALVPRLKELEKESVSFSNMYMVDGTAGTIWSMSASLCGLPLFLPDPEVLNSKTSKFLKSATCLGDLLEDDGYHLAYYGGAHLNFTRKGDFFKTHGFVDVNGKNELLPLLKDPEYLNFWGLYDDSLLDISFKKFMELSKSNQKFGLFLLTVDTHAPGYASMSCQDFPYQDGTNRYLNAVACSDYLISRFIKSIIDSPYASNTIIVLASDHVVMNNTSALHQINEARQSKNKNIFMIIEPGILKGRRVESFGTALDISPTILPFLGYSGHVGLGRNLLRNGQELQHEQEIIVGKLNSWRPQIASFWGIPKVNRQLSINIKKKNISIDSKLYRIPIILKITGDLHATPVDNFGGKTIFQYLKNNFEVDSNYLWVDDCKDIKIKEKNIDSEGIPMSHEGLCLITGNKDEFFYKEQLTSNVQYTVPELQKILIPQNNKDKLVTVIRKNF